MALIHLDTSFLIRALAAGTDEDRRLRGWLRDGTSVGISVVGWAEFLCGPVHDDDVKLAARIVREPVALTPDDAATTGRLFNLAGRRRRSFVDCMIAAAAIRAEATLATADADDFRRFEPAGLRIVSTAG
jgi:predicted nucleic acid-binding protein